MTLQFDNVNCFPLGNATLNIVNNQLVVSNIGNSGLDGVMFEIPSGKTYEIEHDAYPIQPNGNLSITNISLDSNGNIFPSMTESIWHDGNDQKMHFGYDCTNLPATFNIIGFKNGVEIFNIPKDNPIDSDTPVEGIGLVAKIIIGVVTAAATTYIALKTTTREETRREFYPDGTLKTETIVKTEDPTPINVEVEGQTYLVDTWGIKYDQNFSVGNNIIPSNIIGVQMIGKNVNDIKIDSIQLNDIII